MILALSVPKWVSHGSGDSSIELGAYRCTDCPDANQNWSWECFAKYYCFADEDSEACSTYDDGLKGSSGFVLAEIVAILF